MVDILHRVGATAPLDKVYAALSTVEGIAGWWTTDTTGSSEAGGTVAVRFGDVGGFDLEVVEVRPAELVLWEVVDGPREWIGTRIRFELKQEDGFTIVLFRHEGWHEPVEFMYHCSTKWATFLMSLKQLVETGTGEPAPQDVQISNWH
jgi:uncharacterized protein YndB with AHSA1/START domain